LRCDPLPLGGGVKWVRVGGKGEKLFTADHWRCPSSSHLSVRRKKIPPQNAAESGDCLAFLVFFFGSFAEKTFSFLA